ncbi:carboxypeptidase regulatory-like domain-containing protein [Crenothrix polyspora]|uniref:Lipoprotein n=1 Tax=Crenothrix polyspora TaxID=360316 RepID=A0A1R4GYR1_9GAMM|nr:carboxypeptidase regulatory-like domain-containing protein [Crenothrix polyspora]SJM89102.1 exported hypothetical protein [Crenothrix polyspora]
MLKQLFSLFLVLFLFGYCNSIKANNNTCALAKDLTNQKLPFSVTDKLDSSQNPDIDFFKFSIQPEGLIEFFVATGKQNQITGPRIGIFDSQCKKIIDDASRLRLPLKGIVILAITHTNDLAFTGGGNDSYILKAEHIPTIRKFSGRLVDALTQQPLASAALMLRYCDGSGLCDPHGGTAHRQTTDAEGKFTFTDIEKGQHALEFSASGYMDKSILFTVTQDQAHQDAGDFALTSQH